MGRGKKYQPGQVVHRLWQIKVTLAIGKTAAQASREVGSR